MRTVRPKLIEKYVDLYNQEVCQIFDDNLTGDDIYSQLKDSEVHAKSLTARLYSTRSKRPLFDDSDDESTSDEDGNESENEQEDTENLDTDKRKFKRAKYGYLGSIWMKYEKAMFFRCLSRYSIHRLDEWCAMIPSKSKYEILTYYKVLSKNLKLIKNSYMKKFDGILSKSEFPIAYEMSQEWVALEEKIVESLEIKISNYNGDFSPTNDEVVSSTNDNHNSSIDDDPTTTTDSNNNNEATADIEPSTTNNLDLPSANNNDTSTIDTNFADEQLINLDNWYRRWKPIYSNSNLTDVPIFSKVPLEISDDAYQYMIESAKKYLRKLLNHLVLQDINGKNITHENFINLINIQKDSDLSSQTEEEILEKYKSLALKKDDPTNKEVIISTNDSYMQNVYTRDDVYAALRSLKATDTRIFTFADTIINTLTKFDIHYESNSRLFRSKQILNTMNPTFMHYVLATQMQRLLKTVETESLNDIDLESPEYILPLKLRRLETKYRRKIRRLANDPDVTEEDLRSIPHLKNYRISHIMNINDTQFPIEDILNRADNTMELLMCDWEADLFDYYDMINSKIYESSILNELSGNHSKFKLDMDSLPDPPSCPLPLNKSYLKRFFYTND